MDRLLTEQEIRGIVQNTPAGVYDYEAVAQAQDDLTAHLVAQEIFKELEEYFGLHETDCNGKDVLAKLTVREDIVMNYDNKSMNQLNIYQAIKSRHGVLDV